MFSYKAQTYEKMEKQKPEKKFKQNSYEEIRKLVEENDVERQQINSIVKNKKVKQDNKFNFKIFD